MKLIRFTLALLFVVFGLSSVQTAKAETLKDALIGAYRHSGLLEQQRALLRAADEDVAQSLAALRPIVSAQVDAGYGRSAFPGDEWDYSASLGLSASLTLYDGGSSKLGIDAAKESVLSARESLVSVEQQILLRAANAFFEVRRQTEFVGLRRNNVRLIGQELQAAEDRFEVGEVTRTDVALAEARLAGARSSLAASQGALIRAEEEYFNAVGRRPGALSRLPALPKVPSSKEGAVRLAERQHPDIIAAQRNVKISEINVARAEASLKGTLSLRGSATFDQDFNSSDNIGLRYSVPLYQGGQLSSLVRQASQNVAASKASLHIVVHNIRQGVGNAYAGIAVARATKAATDEQVRAADTAFRGVREEATLGARTTLDVLDAEQELLDARTEQISAVIDEQAAIYEALSSLGLLTADYLKLGIRTYDPAAYYNLVKSGPTARSKQGKALDRVLKAIGQE